MAFGESWQNIAAPPKFITIIKQFHDSMHANAQMGLTLFSIMFSAMLFDAFSGSDNGINISYHTDGAVFNLRRLQAKTKVETDIVKFLFSDNCALNTTTKDNMQNSVCMFSIACDNFGLTISTKKTSDAPASI